MIKKWTKLGQIYEPDPVGRHPKLLTHAANPLAIHQEADIFRIFYSGRDERNRSSVGAVDIDIVQRKIVRDYYNPFFEHGPENSFFADGVSIGNSYKANGVQYILFMGWQASQNAHWRGDVGRLIVTLDHRLKLDSQQVFLGIDSVDPISLSYPWVRSASLDKYEMWYGSTLTWDAGNDEMLHVINYATSRDGRKWDRHGLAVPFQIGVAQAFSRPSVVTGTRDSLEMWFSYRSGTGEKYRIGYARSVNGITWELELENAGIDVSCDGWDSEMIEYPFVFDHGDKRYLLYNGNGYGKTGFGLAVQE
ncbi:hypothetical protein IWQ48_000846 [Labrenzia sp. EL_13]|uniref:hypothetical protein n=1 Tax=Roseibium album TaxID=311410 RepID=UPI0018CB1F12|nr:hypothetical protein [Labrenzia sp. EL_195]MBG6199728.1 hypothetical protein [Labrenzia sp. EL_13]